MNILILYAIAVVSFPMGVAFGYWARSPIVPTALPPIVPQTTMITASLELGGASARYRRLILNGLRYESDGIRWFGEGDDGEWIEETGSREVELSRCWALYGPKPPVKAEATS